LGEWLIAQIEEALKLEPEGCQTKFHSRRSSEVLMQQAAEAVATLDRPAGQ
jgi:hypothetical protein